MEYKPTIIGVADATHYLVGVTDTQNNFMALPALQEIASCTSLSQAKQLLRDQHVVSAILTLESAYDEMCGLSVPSVSNQIIHL